MTFISPYNMRIIVLIIWLLFWSLGSVLLIRLGEKVDKETITWILRWRSKCPNCGATLKARNLIPLLSFLRQRGKCDQCKQPISRLYPILEIGSAIIFVVSFLVFQNMWTGIIIFRCVVNRLLFLLIAYDVMKYELHVPLRIVLLVVVAVPQLIFGIGNYQRALASVLVFVVFFLLIYRWAKWYAKKRYGVSEWFGQGDLYMWGVIALLVPFIVQYHELALGRWLIINLLFLFVILSSVIGILLRWMITLIKNLTPWLFTNTVSPLFQDKVLIPFIPAMILAFWILLRKADFFISLLFPLW